MVKILPLILTHSSAMYVVMISCIEDGEFHEISDSSYLFSFSITSSCLKVLILALWLLYYVNFLHWTHSWNSTIIKAQSTSDVECAVESFWMWDVIKLVISSLQSANLRAATGRHRSLSPWCSCIVLTGHCCSCCWCCWLPRDCIHGPSSHRHGDGPRGGNPWWEGAFRCHHICSVCCGGGKRSFTKDNNGSHGGVLAVVIAVMSLKTPKEVVESIVTSPNEVNTFFSNTF